jgi:putative transcriptional regulator
VNGYVTIPPGGLQASDNWPLNIGASRRFVSIYLNIFMFNIKYSLTVINIIFMISFMAIEIRLDLVMVKKKMSLTELAEKVGISMTNLSLLKTGKVKGIRFSTLDAICRELECQPGDILEHIPDFV